MIDEMKNALRVQIVITKKIDGGEEVEVMRKGCVVDLDVASDALGLFSKGCRMLNRAVEHSTPKIVQDITDEYRSSLEGGK